MSTLFDWLVRTSLDAAWLGALVAFVIAILGRHLGPRWRYALWSLVLLRIFVPQPLPQDLTVAAPRFEEAAPSHWISKVWKPDATPTEVSSSALIRTTPRTSSLLSATERTPAAVVAFAPELPSEHVEFAAEPSIDPVAAVISAWLSIAAALFLLGVYRERRFRTELRISARRADPRWRAVLESECERAGVRRTPELFCSSTVNAPCLSGWLSPRIVLPLASPAALRRNALRCVFAHELAHVKRHDVLRNWVLHAIACTFWFHPFVLLAVRRMRSTAEELCDLASVASGSASTSRRYAATLLRLSQSFTSTAYTTPTAGALSGAKELRQRIRTVMHHKPTRPLIWIPTLASLCALSWLGLTQAAEQADAVLPHAVEDGAQVRPAQHIEVVKQQAEPAWRAALAAKLRSTPVEIDASEMELSVLAAELSALTQCSIVVDPSVAENYDEFHFTVKTNGMLDAVLDRVTAHSVLTWEFENGGVLIAPRESHAFSTDLRFYRVDSLIGAGSDDERMERLDQLRDLIVGVGVSDCSWDQGPRISIEPWRHALMVRQRDRMHARVHAFLELLAARGQGASMTPSAPTSNLEELLNRTTSFGFEHVEVEEVEAKLRALGLPVEFDACVRDMGHEFNIVVHEMNVRDALAKIAALVDAHVELLGETIWIGQQPTLQVEVFPAGDLLGSSEDPEAREMRAERLIDALRNAVDPASWDALETRLAFWNDLLVVRQTQHNLLLTRETLAAMRQVLN